MRPMKKLFRYPYIVVRSSALLPLRAVGYKHRPDKNYKYYPSVNAIFVSVPKNASRTVIHTLNENADTNREEPIPLTRRQFINTDTSDVLVFGFSRNPLTRLISCYKSKVVNSHHYSLMHNYFGCIYPNMPFATFVRTICRIPDRFAEEHFRSQTHLLTPPIKSEERSVDIIGTVENFTDDFNNIAEKLAITPPSEKRNVSNQTPPDLTEWYDKALAEKVYRRYKQDFVALGYQKEYQNLLHQLT